MQDHPSPPLEELLWTTSAARLVFGPHMAIQVPPNLTPEAGAYTRSHFSPTWALLSSL